jgi:hypothetical protein
MDLSLLLLLHTKNQQLNRIKAILQLAQKRKAAGDIVLSGAKVYCFCPNFIFSGNYQFLIFMKKVILLFYNTYWFYSVHKHSLFARKERNKTI